MPSYKCADISRIYESLAMPIWLGYGTRGEFSDVDAGRAEGLASWAAQAFAAGGIPYFEQPEQFIAAYDIFHQQALSEHRA